MQVRFELLLIHQLSAKIQQKSCHFFLTKAILIQQSLSAIIVL